MENAASNSRALDGALVSGIAWTAVLRWASEIVSWGATIFAARILLPADYGLMSMALIPIGLVRMVEDFGLDAILVQDRTIVGERQARLAGFVLGLGACLAAVSLLLANPIASFFDEPQVAGIIGALSVLFLTDALQVVPRATLQRNLAYSRIATVLFVQVVATQAVLIAAALAGFGVWSLALSQIAGAIVITILLYAWAPFTLRVPRQIRELSTPLLQGWRVMVSRFAYYAYVTADQTIIGRFLGKDALGAYSFSMQFATLPFQEVNSVITRVVPGIFSEVQHRKDELRRYFLTLTEAMAYITLPMSAGLALTADLTVDVVLGPNWGSVAAPLQAMCLFAAFQSMQILISPLLMWTGQFRAQMWCSIITGVALPLGFLGAVHYGLVAIALVWSVLYPISNIPALVFGLRTVSVSFAGWLETARPAGVGCAVMALAVIGLRIVTRGQPDALRLVLCVGVGALTYAAVVWLVFRRRVIALVRFVLATRQRQTGKTADSPPDTVTPAQV